jgi:hypothetical protein
VFHLKFVNISNFLFSRPFDHSAVPFSIGLYLKVCDLYFFKEVSMVPVTLFMVWNDFLKPQKSLKSVQVKNSIFFQTKNLLQEKG